MTIVTRLPRRLRTSAWFEKLVRPPKDDPKGPIAVPIIEQYVNEAPSSQHAVDIFAGEWSSSLPPSAGVIAGHVPLFADDRIKIAVAHLGGVEGLDVLELGPLEGGHTWMLSQMGARSITAVEANSRAYLKCLIAKEILATRGASFLLGDLLGYLKEVDCRFDAVLASGVLYHMQDPIELLRQIGRHTDRLILWTHYYDSSILTPSHPQGRLFSGNVASTGLDGRPLIGYRHEYREGLQSQSFCGSGSTWSIWLDRATILSTLDTMGFGQLRIDFDDPQHPNGPAFLVTAWR